MTNEELLSRARQAMEKSYSPYSKFKVGAALLTSNNKIYSGCNVENSSFGATICAERTAAVKAVSEGEREFVRLAIVSSEGEFTYPCGICRQFYSEFVKDCIVIMEDRTEGIKEVKFTELFPDMFSFEVKNGN